MHIVTQTLLFNIGVVLLFSVLYASIEPNHFQPLQPKDTLTYIDYLFYATTIQAGVGLPDITAVTNLAKLLAIVQQWIQIGTMFLLFWIAGKTQVKKG